MWLCVECLDSRVDNSQVGEFLLQDTGRLLLHIKFFQRLGHLHMKWLLEEYKVEYVDLE